MGRDLRDASVSWLRRLEAVGNLDGEVTSPMLHSSNTQCTALMS